MSNKWKVITHDLRNVVVIRSLRLGFANLLKSIHPPLDWTGLHVHVVHRGCVAFPWIFLGMEKGRRRDKTWSRGREYPREAIFFLERKLQVLWMCSWFSPALHLPMQRQDDEQRSKHPKSCSEGFYSMGKMDELCVGERHPWYSIIHLSQGIRKQKYSFVRVIFPLSEDREKKQQNL